MNVEPTAPTAADQATSDTTLLDPSSHVTAAPVTAAPVTAAPVTAAPVTAGEIAEFLGHLTELRVSGRDAEPAARTAFLHRKAQLFTRLATGSTGPTGPPERGTP